MSLPDEHLLLIEDVAESLKRSKEYVLTRLRQRKFQQVTIEYLTKSGGQWTAHYYFDKAVWPFKKKATRHEEGNDLHFLLKRTDGDERWLEGAREIFIPASAVEVYKGKNDIWPEYPHPSASPIHTNQSDFSKMSQNLRIAIQADTELYSRGKIQEKRGHREQIDAWLKKHHNLTKNTRAAIIAVVNRKKGGPPRND